MNATLPFVPEPTVPRGGQVGWIVVLLIVLTLAAHGCGCWNGFVHYDDSEFILNNPQVQAGLTADSLWWSLTTFMPHNWHPLTWMSYQLDHELHGLRPWGYHLTNLLLHVANVVLVFVVLWQTTGWVGRSALVAAFFAVHPQHVQSVAWVAQRKDLLCVFFGLITLLLYLGYARRPRLWRYGLVVLGYVLCLMSKQMLVTLPCLLLLLDYWPLRRGPARTRTPPVGLAGQEVPTRPLMQLIAEKLPLLFLSWIASQFTWAAQVPAMHLEISLEGRVSNAAVSAGKYVVQTFWPANLAVFYPHPGESLTAFDKGWAITLLAGVSLLALVGWRRWPFVLVGWLWFLGTLVPVLGLVQVGDQGMADRYTYFPALGLYLLVIWSLAEILSRWPVAILPRALAVGAALLACVLLTWQQTVCWSDPCTLFERVVAIHPEHGATHNLLGMAYIKQERLEEAVVAFRRATELIPESDRYFLRLAVALRKLGRHEEAEEALHQAFLLNLRASRGEQAAP